MQVRNVNILGPDGKPVGGQAGPPERRNRESWITVPSLAEWELAEPIRPTGADQVVVDKNTSEKTGYGLGTKITVLLPNGQRAQPTVVGIAQASLSSSGAGASMIAWIFRPRRRC